MNDAKQRLYNRYGKELVDELFTYPQDVFIKAVTKLIEYEKEGRKKEGSEERIQPMPQEDPHVYLVGGQPGCGKSGGMKRACAREENHGNAIIISMDCYRNMHPNINKIKEVIFKRCNELGLSSDDMSADLVAFTNEFADKVEEYIVPRLFDAGYNLVMESTLKNGKKNVDKMRALREKNPKCEVNVIMMGISQEVAYEGAISRAAQMKICMERLVSEMEARGITDIYPVTRGPVDKAYYDDICSKLPSSIEEFTKPENKEIINGNVLIMDRAGRVEYDRENADPLNNNPAEIQESCLRGRIAEKQMREHREREAGNTKFYGVEAFMEENKIIASQIFGSEKLATQMFEEAVLEENQGPKM